MQNRKLIDLCDNKLLLVGHHSRLDEAIEKYGEIRTFFGGFRNPVGIEVETERAKALYDNISHNGSLFWRGDGDGSLRDNGVEFISVPLSGTCIDYALHELFTLEKKYPVKWGHRTSIHVHVNVSSFYESDLYAFLALYSLFEESFFGFVAPMRADNPYCYKLTNCSPTIRFGQGYKYCAFNISPVSMYCTVEFRHLEGTNDVKKIRRWIQLIVKLHRYVSLMKGAVYKRIKQTIEDDAYDSLAKEIFGASVILFNDIKRDCDSTSLWTLSFIENLCADYTE